MTPTFPYPGILAVNATFNAEALAQYLQNLTGPYTKAQGSSTGFLSLDMVTDQASEILASLGAQNPGDHLPSIYQSDKTLVAGFAAQKQLITSQIEAGSVAILELPFSGGGAIPNAIEKPLSRGTVHLNASNPHGEPVVSFNAFANPFDKSVLAATVEFTRKLMAADPLKYLNPVELTPGPNATTTDQIFNALLNGKSPFGTAALNPSFAHPSCSCPMMPQKLGGVVSSDLLVYGVDALSIVDCSILPIIPAAHLQATMYAVAEKAADIIKKRNGSWH